MISDMVQKILKNGVEIQVLPNQFDIPLSDQDTVVFLEKGSVNLFAIEKKEGHPEGLRTLITTFEAPTPLFGFVLPQDARYAILAITEQSSRLFSIPLIQIKKRSKQTPPSSLLGLINSPPSTKKRSAQKTPSTSLPFKKSNCNQKHPWRHYARILTKKRTKSIGSKSKEKRPRFWITLLSQSPKALFPHLYGMDQKSYSDESHSGGTPQQLENRAFPFTPSDLLLSLFAPGNRQR